MSKPVSKNEAMRELAYHCDIWTRQDLVSYVFLTEFKRLESLSNSQLEREYSKLFKDKISIID